MNSLRTHFGQWRAFFQRRRRFYYVFRLWLLPLSGGAETALELQENGGAWEVRESAGAWECEAAWSVLRPGCAWSPSGSGRGAEASSSDRSFTLLAEDDVWSSGSGEPQERKKRSGSL